MKFLNTLAFALAASSFWTYAAEPEYEPRPVPITVTATQNTFENLTLQVDKFHVWYEHHDEVQSHWEYDCDTDVGDGSTGNWHDYFSVPKSEKPEALSLAVKGIGYSTAKRIVQSGKYFVRKPRSWNAFKSEIRGIAADDRIDSPDIYQNVIRVYGKENAASLGYAGDTHCEWKEVKERVRVTEKKRERVDTLSKSIDLRFEGGVLLSSEKEYFVVLFDGEEISVPSKGALNQYNLEKRGNQYIMKAIQRWRATPAIGSLLVTFEKRDGTLKLNIADPLMEEILKISPNSFLELNYEVIRTSGINNAEAKGSVTMRGREITLDMKNDPTWEKKMFGGQKALTPGKAYKVRLSYKRSGTDLFNGESSETMDTSEQTY